MNRKENKNEKENAGAKYVVPAGIHHDSFALCNSDIQTAYNSAAQAGVDYIGELQKALYAPCRLRTVLQYPN
ncbi:MAG: alpha-L-fucosidase [Oscillospiraceae bacterium]|nr:alpha-L-fucosidase [Oscillospiraceae bacterium]